MDSITCPAPSPVLAAASVVLVQPPSLSESESHSILHSASGRCSKAAVLQFVLFGVVWGVVLALISSAVRLNTASSLPSQAAYANRFLKEAAAVHRQYAAFAWTGDHSDLCVQVHALEPATGLCDFFLLGVTGLISSSAYVHLCAEREVIHCFSLPTEGVYYVRVQAEIVELGEQFLHPDFPADLNSTNWPRWGASRATLLTAALQMSPANSSPVAKAETCSDLGQEGNWHYRPDLVDQATFFPGDAWVYAPRGCEPSVISPSQLRQCLIGGGGSLTIAGDSTTREIYTEVAALLLNTTDHALLWHAPKQSDQSLALNTNVSVHFKWTPYGFDVDSIVQTRPRFAFLTSGLWYVKDRNLTSFETAINATIAGIRQHPNIAWFWMTMPFSNGVELLRAHPRLQRWNERTTALMRAADVKVVNYWSMTMARPDEGDFNTHYGMWSADKRVKGVCPKAVVNLWTKHVCSL